jgi:TRAP-type C4-dicarboxylate transport system permease small subunit
MNGLLFFTRVLGKFNRASLFVCKYATIFLVGVISIVVCAGVYWRYVLNNSLSWTEETAKFLMVWMVFAGIPIALKTGGHAAIDALPNALPQRGRQMLYAFIYLVILLLSAVLVHQGWGFAWNARVQNTATTQVSMMYVFGSMPFGGAILFFVSLEMLLQSVIGVFRPSDGIVLDEIEMARTSPE